MNAPAPASTPLSPALTPPADEPAFLAALNPPQREAVLTTEGPVLMLAGAGTGKTAALTARLAWLVSQRRAWPSEILCVTFTNRAAREMRERVGLALGAAAEGMPWLGTFHAIAAKMLRSHAELVGLHGNFTILNTDDQLRLLKQLIIAEGLDEKRWPARLLAACLDRWKNRGLTPDDLDAAASEAFAHGKGQHFYRLYQTRLQTLNACDFGDLLLHMLVILRRDRDVLAQYQRRLRYIMVDEYQDTNQAQYLWLRLLAQGRNNICVVGDDDQSIYSWRGAEIANILRFEKDFPGAKVIRLEQNYRSTPDILGAAAGLIGSNRERLGKSLWTTAQGGEKLRIIGVWDAPEEARRVSDEIEALERAGTPLTRVAILVRAQFQTREFEDRFIAIGLSYRIVGGFRFYERAEIRDALAYLRLIAQPADDLAFERIINVPKRGLGEKAMERLHRLARATGMPLARAALAIADTDELPARPRGTLVALARDFARWRELAGSLSPAELARQVLDESGYTAMLQAEKSAENAGRLENLAELARAMEEYDSLGAFLEHVGLVMDNDANDEAQKVTIMTIHAAKGLEFDHVFLPGWEEGVFPSQRALDEGGLAALEEERRLAYVAITRARMRCAILHAGNRRIYGQWTSAIPSRFIAELPEEHVSVETTVTGGGGWRGHEPPFGAHRFGGKGPNQRGPSSFDPTARDPTARRIVEPRRYGEAPRYGAAGYGTNSRGDISVGDRVSHPRFGEGTVIRREGNALEINFDAAGSKRVIDAFVESVG